MNINQNIIPGKTLNKLRNIFSKNKTVIAAYLFGSKISGSDRLGSDIDLAVVVSDRDKCQEMDLLPEISSISFPAEIDLSVVDLSSSPFFLYQIVKKGVCIYENNKVERISFEAKVLHLYYDSQHMRDIYNYYLDKSIKEGSYGRR